MSIGDVISLEDESTQDEPNEEEVQAVRKELRANAQAAHDRLNRADKRRGEPATMGDLSDLADLLIYSAMSFSIAHVRRRAVLREDAAAETTIRTLQPVWRGIWREGQAHSKDSMVVHDSALWVAVRATTGKPGTADSGFKLVCKSPR